MATYERVTKNGKITNRWSVRYRDENGENKRIAAPDEKTAKGLAGKIEAHYCMFPGTPYLRDGAPKVQTALLDDVSVLWLRDLARTKKPRTVDVYGQAVRLFLRFVGSDATIAALNSETITAYDAHRAAGNLSANSRSADVSVLSGLWRWSWEHRATVAVGAVEPVRVERPDRVVPTAVAPTWAESAACVSFLPSESIAYRRAVMAYYTGLRTFQITGAHYSDRLEGVDPKAVAVIVDVVNGTMRVVKGKTKAETALRRVVPLSPAFVVALREWHASDPRPVVCWGNENNAVNLITKAWRTAVAAGKARLEVFGPSIETARTACSPNHAFRRGLTTGLKAAGADVEAAEYYVGHKMPGVRGQYLDAAVLKCAEAVAMIPALPPRAPVASNVVAFTPVAMAAAK